MKFLRPELRSTILAGTALSGALAGVLASMPAASAVQTDPVQVWDGSGSLKAQASYNDQNNQLCTRAYNGVKGSSSFVIARWAGGNLYAFGDTGGDTTPECANMTAALDYREDRAFEFKVIWYPAGGGSPKESGWRQADM